MSIFAEKANVLRNITTHKPWSRVTRVIGLVIESTGLDVPVGAYCSIQTDDGFTDAEVVGFRDDATLLMPFGDMRGIKRGAQVICLSNSQNVNVGPALLGRVLNAKGEPIDGKGAIETEGFNPLYADPPNPIFRRPVDEPLGTGIRSIDGLITVGKGQRLGIFAGSGVGKSVTMGMIARYTQADISVIVMVGERGREVRHFIEHELGPEGLARSVVIVATSDQSPLLRVRSGFIGSAIAEYFREQGRDVVLMMDSVTRVSMAQREIGLSIGEPPATKGYPPSVFSLMPRLMERSGTSEKGSITGFYTVLVEGDDMNEPIADTARGILDGHIVLNRKLAQKNHYPAIDVLQSLSRVMSDVADKEHLQSAAKLREILATYAEAEDLINIGAYSKGSNPAVDKAIANIDAVTNYLRQGMNEHYDFAINSTLLKKLLATPEEQNNNANQGGLING